MPMTSFRTETFRVADETIVFVTRISSGRIESGCNDEDGAIGDRWWLTTINLDALRLMSCPERIFSTLPYLVFFRFKDSASTAFVFDKMTVSSRAIDKMNRALTPFGRGATVDSWKYFLDVIIIWKRTFAHRNSARPSPIRLTSTSMVSKKLKTSFLRSKE